MKNNYYVKSIIMVVLVVGLAGELSYLIYSKNIKSENSESKYATFVVDGVDYGEKIEIKDGKFDVPKPPNKDGYVFEYWEVDGEKYDSNKKYEENVTLKAVFTQEIENKEEENTSNSDVDIKEEDTKDNVTENDDTHIVKKNLLGDVNEDSKINGEDRVLLRKYLEGSTTLSSQALKNADVNNDGKVNEIDSILLRQYSVGVYSELPITNYVIYGDINEDGKINGEDRVLLRKYLEGSETLNSQALKNADVNNDGKVNEIDSVLLRQFTVGKYDSLPYEPITNYVLYGDVNEDGKINALDRVMLRKYLEGTETLSSQALKNADINNDGQINDEDKQLLRDFTMEIYGNLPYEPITSKN